MSVIVGIIGAGQAAVQAVTSLRAEGYRGRITLYGDELYLPYQRPPLSKAYLADEMTEHRLELKARNFYTDLGVDVHLGARVSRILPGENILELSDTRSNKYDVLVLATGTRAKRLQLSNANLAGVHSIRTIEDVRRFRADCRPGARLVIVGGGYIGLEVAAKARKLGLDVTVVEFQKRVLSRAVCDVVSAHLADLHTKMGVRILVEIGVTRIFGAGRVTGVELTNGDVLPAEIVLSAVGALPNAELAMQAGLTVENGIEVDTSARTSSSDIFAIGDVASFPSARYGRRLRLESVQNAVDQAKVAAKAIVGKPVDYDPVPWFWSDQYDTKLQIAGVPDGYQQIECVGDIAAGKFSVRYFADDRLIAVCSVNDAKSHMHARQELAGAPLLQAGGQNDPCSPRGILPRG